MEARGNTEECKLRVKLVRGQFDCLYAEHVPGHNLWQDFLYFSVSTQQKNTFRTNMWLPAWHTLNTILALALPFATLLLYIPET